MSNANQILAEAQAQIRNNPARPLAHTVAIFNTITGHTITEREGFIFVLALKLALSQDGKPKLDTFAELAGHAALLGECALGERLQNLEPTPTK